MNPVIKVKTDEAGCVKPGCKHKFTVPHRHHRRHEKLFIDVFRKTTKIKTGTYRELRKNYEAFRDKDIVRICHWHHVEIHELYKELTVTEELVLGKMLSFFTWKEARGLMKKYYDTCRAWEKEDTPGLDPKIWEKRKRARIYGPKRRRRY